MRLSNHCRRSGIRYALSEGKRYEVAACLFRGCSVELAFGRTPNPEQVMSQTVCTEFQNRRTQPIELRRIRISEVVSMVLAAMWRALLTLILLL